MQAMAGTMWALGAANKAPAVSWWLSGGVSAANAIAAYAPKGAASLAASYVNLANPGTHDLTLGSAPSWDATNGWTSAGAAVLRTGIVWENNQTWSAFVRFSGIPGVATRALFGSYTTDNNQFLIYPYRTSSVDYRNGANFSEGAQLTAGVLGFAGRRGYRNGTPTTNLIPATASGTNSLQLYLLAVNYNNGSIQNIIGSVQAFAIYNTTLTDGQALAVSNAMTAL